MPAMMSEKCWKGYLEATTHCPEVGSSQKRPKNKGMQETEGTGSPHVCWRGRRICNGEASSCPVLLYSLPFPLLGCRGVCECARVCAH